MFELLSQPLPRFLVLAALIIGLSRALGVIARRVNQPMVIAEIVAGILLGPSVLGWLWPQLGAALLPQHAIDLLGMVSQLGLVLFMFLVGLELDLGVLRDRARTSIAVSFGSIAVPFGLGLALSFQLYPSLAPASVPLRSFALFLGAALCVTAFPVLARILAERRLLRTRIGATAITCAAINDVVAWCILAFVVSAVRARGLADAAWTSICSAVYIAIMVFGVRPLLARVSDRNRSGLSQDLVAMVVLLLLLSSAATELIGIHALFGAFLFGAVLPKRGRLAASLAEKVEDLVLVLLLPLFFAYSGLRTELGLLSTPGAWWSALLVIAVATIGKFAGSAGFAWLMGMKWREASALGILMNTRGLMELIILNVGLDLGVISPTLFTIMVVMALVTTLATTPALAWVYPSADFARDQLAESDHGASSSSSGSSRPFTALVCVADERSAPGLLAVASAATGKGDGESRLYALTLTSAERASAILRQGDEASFDGNKPEALEALGRSARQLGVRYRPLSFASGDPVRDICEMAKLKHADLIVLGWHQPVLGQAMLGGTVHGVMERAQADVAVLVDRGLSKMTKLLVPYLGSSHDQAALCLARRIAENTGAAVTVLHVVLTGSVPGTLGAREHMQREFTESSRKGHYDVVFKAVPHASPSAAVLEECARGYDLVLIGADKDWELEHRAFGLQREPILARAPCSVLAVR